eukprot:2700546-Amphidinium_carterae.4
MVANLSEVDNKASGLALQLMRQITHALDRSTTRLGRSTRTMARLRLPPEGGGSAATSTSKLEPMVAGKCPSNLFSHKCNTRS